MGNAPITRDERLRYAFGHLVSAFAHPDDAHAAASHEHGEEMLISLGCRDIPDIVALAEYVAGDYEYTGHTTELRRKIENGEL